MRPTSHVRWTTLALILLGGLLPSPLSSQGAAAPPTCATLLPAAALAKAVGTSMNDMGVDDRGEGRTECSWMARGGSAGFRSVAVQFADMRAVAAHGEAPGLDPYFELEVASAEAAGSARREVLDGIGRKAAFVAAAPQMVVVVQRAEGVARIVGNNLTKAQITAVARVIGGT